MARLDYPLFRLMESCAENGGYLVQRKSDNALVAVVVRHPDDPPASRWEVRPYYGPRKPGGRHGLLRDAAQAGFDEYTDTENPKGETFTGPGPGECANGSPTCTPEDPCVICHDAENEKGN